MALHGDLVADPESGIVAFVAADPAAARAIRSFVLMGATLYARDAQGGETEVARIPARMHELWRRAPTVLVGWVDKGQQGAAEVPLTHAASVRHGTGGDAPVLTTSGPHLARQARWRATAGKLLRWAAGMGGGALLYLLFAR